MKYFIYLLLLQLVFSQTYSFQENSGVDVNIIRSGNLPAPFNLGGLNGIAWIDYDNDNDLDLFAVQALGIRHSLWQNINGSLMTDSAVAAGFSSRAGGTAVAAADLNNDGFVDLIVSGEGALYGPTNGATQVYQNNGDGTFSDVTSTSRISAPLGSAQVTLFDANLDGYLDVFVGGAAHLDLSEMETFGENQTFPSYFFLNNGDFTWTLTDVGLNATGVCVSSAADFNADGFPDLLVGSCLPDSGELTLFTNNGDLTFTDTTSQAFATAPTGRLLSISLGDYNNDALLDIWISNFAASHSLWQNNGDGTFSDNTNAITGLAGLASGAGAAFGDFDNDGDEDFTFVGNFAATNDFGNPGYHLENNNGILIDLTSTASPFNLSTFECFGLATADWNSDGFLDYATTCTDQRWFVATNNVDTPTNNWVSFRVSGTVIDPNAEVEEDEEEEEEETIFNASGVGAVVTVTGCGNTQIRQIAAGTGGFSTNSPYPHFGIGACTEEVSVIVTWPGNVMEDFGSFPINQFNTLIAGQGSVVVDSGVDSDETSLLSDGEQAGIVIAVIIGACCFFIIGSLCIAGYSRLAKLIDADSKQLEEEEELKEAPQEKEEEEEAKKSSSEKTTSSSSSEEN